MSPKVIDLLYDCFYSAPGLPEQVREAEQCRRALCETLDKSERRLLLQLIDAKDSIADKTSQDSFVAGFQLAWQLSHELNNYKNERIATHDAERPGARFILTEEEKS